MAERAGSWLATDVMFVDLFKFRNQARDCYFLRSTTPFLVRLLAQTVSLFTVAHLALLSACQVGFLKSRFSYSLDALYSALRLPHERMTLRWWFRAGFDRDPLPLLRARIFSCQLRFKQMSGNHMQRVLSYVPFFYTIFK